MTTKEMVRLIIVASTVMALAGCATVAERQYRAIVSNNSAAAAQLRACYAKIYNSPVAAPLRRHVPLSIDDVTLQQLSDSNFATDDEIKAILREHPLIVACRKAALHKIGLATPTFVPIIAAAYGKTDDLLVELIKKKISWGAFMTGVRNVSTNLRAELSAEGQRITAGLERSQEAELARRQEAARAFQEYMQRQEVINSLNRPTITNCYRMGYSVNCVSQ